jgi:hypothetical protein
LAGENVPEDSAVFVSGDDERFEQAGDPVEGKVEAVLFAGREGKEKSREGSAYSFDLRCDSTQEKRASDRSRNAQESTNESLDDVGLDVFVVLEDEDLGVVRSKPFGQAVGAGDVAERAVGLEKVEEFLHKRYE